MELTKEDIEKYATEEEKNILNEQYGEYSEVGGDSTGAAIQNLNEKFLKMEQVIAAIYEKVFGEKVV